MVVKDTAIEMLKEGYVCDRCLGRAFSQLLTGTDNQTRGKTIRYYIAMLIDSEEKIDVDNSNFYGIKFHNVKIKPKTPKKCTVCLDLFVDFKKKVKPNKSD